MLREVSPVKNINNRKSRFKRKKPEAGVSHFSYVSPSDKQKNYVSISDEDKKEYLKNLNRSELGVGKLNKSKEKEKAKQEIVKKPSKLAKISNRFFSGFSENLAPKFSSLEDDLKKANIRFLTTTYISIALFVSSFILILSSLFMAGVLIFDFSYVNFAWLPIVFFLLSLMAFYFYPATERKSVQKKISQELPFATIHMGAISGSNIEPTKIFKIIASSDEYKHVGMEIKKVIVQIEIYGYDLVTALNNVARNTSSEELSELFSGLATNISSGGSLANYLNKKADNYLMDYKLERQKYSSLAGTFMDVYISILIAAPLVLMMMFIIMNVSGFGLAGLGIMSLLFISIGGVILVNIVFIIVLEIKQPNV